MWGVEMASMTVRRRLLGGAAALAITGLTVSAVLASGTTHASARFYDGAGNPVGWARFVEDATGTVHVNVKVEGLSPGMHGIHLHATGRCIGPAFTSANGHHNPGGDQHGLVNPLGPHNGDLPNMVVNADGRGRLNTTTDLATLSPGSRSVFDGDGSAIIIHAMSDDQRTDPTGLSGGRIACGVIEAD